MEIFHVVLGFFWLIAGCVSFYPDYEPRFSGILCFYQDS